MDKLPNTTTQHQQAEETDTTYQQTELLQTETVDTPETKNVENSTVNEELVDQVGQLTRTLHNSLLALGYDKQLEKITAEVPEAQDQLSYIASKTQQAAERVLNATEITMPIQDSLSSQAINLSQQWNEVLETRQPLPPDTEKFRDLLIQTLTYLNEVPKLTDATNSHLMEIMMAQDFQDLTGQVIKKVTKMVQDLEVDLLQLLVKNTSNNTQTSRKNGLLNGPITNPEKSSDVITDQNQVDDILASLGF